MNNFGRTVLKVVGTVMGAAIAIIVALVVVAKWEEAGDTAHAFVVSLIAAIIALVILIPLTHVFVLPKLEQTSANPWVNLVIVLLLAAVITALTAGAASLAMAWFN